MKIIGFKISGYIIAMLLIMAVGTIFRLYHIEFGLPHSFYADEPEISEPAIKYTYELKDIISNNNFYKLIPISYVYGTVPTYFFTIKVIAFSKFMNLLSIPFDKTTLFIYMRIVNALFSLIIPMGGAYLAWILFKKKSLALGTLALLALNWKLTVHAHYLNQDMFLTTFITLSSIFLYNYFVAENSGKQTLHTVLAGVLFGLAVGTKITALISLPLFLWIFCKRRDLYGIVGFCLVAAGTFALTNPFSVIFIQDFIFRVMRMGTQEAGIVFDSVDLNPLKYISALALISTPLVLLFALFGRFAYCKLNLGKYLVNKRGDLPFHIFLTLNVFLYLIFYSVQSRRVDRWLLPILPIVLIYASYGITLLMEKLPKFYKVSLTIVLAICYMYYPALLMKQFSRWTPKSEAYLWAKENLPQLSTKLVYTEEGLDPMNKLDSAKVYQFEVYESRDAQFFKPDPLLDAYDYVIISSRPMENFKRKAVVDKYPEYAAEWNKFENTLNNRSKYQLIKEFVLSKPNLIPLSDVYIYKKL